MSDQEINASALVKSFIDKASLKQEIYFRTLETFSHFKAEAGKFIESYRNNVSKSKYPLLFEYKDRGDFQFELRFGSDILIFMMHTNIFEGQILLLC